MKIAFTNISGISLTSRYDYEQTNPPHLSAWKKQPDTHLLADSIITYTICVMSSKNTVVVLPCVMCESDSKIALLAPVPCPKMVIFLGAPPKKLM